MPVLQTNSTKTAKHFFGGNTKQQIASKRNRTKYEYDDASKKARGRLHRITDSTGETSWTYNSFGEVISKTQTIGTVSLTTDYEYVPNGQLEWMTLPSGKIVYYGYDLYLPDSVTVNTETILQGAEYEPFGPVKGWTWGNAMPSTRNYDTRGLLIGQTMLSHTRVLGYDSVGRLDALDDGRPLGEIDYSELVPQAGTFELTVLPYSNQLDTVSGPVAKDYEHDAAGNVTTDGLHDYGYDDRGRLNTVDAGATASYQHNGQGQRVSKDSGSTTLLFVYDEAGNLIGEYDASGSPIREHLWFNGAPVAVLSGADAYYVHTDQLGTPRVISDGAEEIWRWVSDPFGSTAPDEDPDEDLTLFTYNLRFPGQYYDAETGLHYNYFRTYDPSTGSYLESDPIGLDGGLNTYGYAGGNPVRYVDPTGEAIALPIAAGVARECLKSGVCMGTVGAATAVAIGCLLNPSLCSAIITEACADANDAINQLLKPLHNNLPLDAGGEEWGRRNGVGADEGRRRAHRIKQRDRMSGARDKYTVDPITGDVFDPEGEYVGNLNDEKS